MEAWDLVLDGTLAQLDRLSVRSCNHSWCRSLCYPTAGERITAGFQKAADLDLSVATSMARVGPRFLGLEVQGNQCNEAEVSCVCQDRRTEIPLQ